MACCVSTVLSGSGSVRARSVRATPARVGSRPATKAPRSKGLWSDPASSAASRAFQSSRAGVVTKGSSVMRAAVASRWLG